MIKGMYASRIRIAHRRDKPERGIIYRLRLAGWAVFPLTGTPGLPDLLCVKRGALHLVEVKEEGGPVTLAQVKMHKALLRCGYVVAIVSTPEEALEVLENGAQPRTFEGMRVSRRAPRRRYQPAPEDLP